MTQQKIKPIREWIADNQEKPKFDPHKTKPTIYTVKCKNCLRNINFNPEKPFTGLCSCGSAVVSKSDKEPGWAIFYSSHIIQ